MVHYLRIEDLEAALRLDGAGDLYWIPGEVASISHAYGHDHSPTYLFPAVYGAPDDARLGRLEEYDRGQAERLVGSYLANPLRHASLDRVLIRLLVEAEYFAYCRAMLTPGALAYQPLRRMGVISELMLNVIGNTLFGAGATWGLWAIGRYTPVPESWVIWPIGAVWLWWLWATCVLLIALPSAWMRLRGARAKTLEILAGQNDARLALLSDGPISVRVVAQKIRDAAGQGTIWPPAIFPLIEDVEKRLERI